MNDQLPKLCVILGAGASHDVWDEGALTLNGGASKPPLAGDLFRVEFEGQSSFSHARFQVIQPYPDARYVAARVNDLMLRGSRGAQVPAIENALSVIARHPDPAERDKYKQGPPYLRDLLYRSSYEYISDPSCYIALVGRVLADQPHRVLFLVLNYDDLLEQALDGRNRNTRYDSIGSYIDPQHESLLVKIHGSVTWFKGISADTSRSWDDLVTSIPVEDLIAKPDVDQVEIHRTPTQSSQHIKINGGHGYPILTAPLAGKGSMAMVCPDRHVQEAENFLTDCRKFLIIGTSGNDQDLFDLLKRELGNRTTGTNKINVVDFGRAEQVFRKYIQEVPKLNAVAPGTDGEVCDLGFRAYLRHRQFQELLDWGY